jgi:hypothetical protein
VEEIRSSLAPNTPVEVWFQDEMRVGQKNKLAYRWARKGSRPRATHDQRTQSTYLFGAVCPELGTGAALVLPFCNSEAMQLHLDEIATKVGPGAHAIVILDQAGWHGAKQLKVPHNISLIPLPPRSPELNIQENIWQFMRQNWLSNRVFKSYDDIVDHCCYAWKPNRPPFPSSISEPALPEEVHDHHCPSRRLSGIEPDSSSIKAETVPLAVEPAQVNDGIVHIGRFQG